MWCELEVFTLRDAGDEANVLEIDVAGVRSGQPPAAYATPYPITEYMDLHYLLGQSLGRVRSSRGRISIIRIIKIPSPRMGVIDRNTRNTFG